MRSGFHSLIFQGGPQLNNIEQNDDWKNATSRRTAGAWRPAHACGRSGWMGGYVGPWGAICLIAVIAILVVWIIIQRKGK
jgi:hypothetical protein